jgi:isochorismate hydrolase
MLLAGAARELGLPVVMTEQYPEKLGHTERHLAKAAQSLPIAKMLFSACTEQTLSVIRATGRRSVLLCGIEAHVCVLQSALDLLEQGFTVFVAEDAIASRRKADRRIGWQRMLGAGALPTSTESAIFELLREAGTDEFRALLPLLKE